jgi:intein/homing endonuclease
MEAKDKILRAKIQLQKSNPFFSYLLLHLKIQESKDLPFESMGVDNRGNLFYSEKFVDKLTEAQVEAVLCFTSNTFINGEYPTNIDSLKIGDKVYNSKNELTEVKKLFKRKYNGEIYNIFGRNLLPFEATPEHPIYIGRTPQFNQKENRSLKEQIKNIKYMWVRAKDIKIGDFLVIPKIKTIKNISKLDIKAFRNKFKNEKRKDDTIPLNKDTAYLMGLYLADGSTSKRAVQISLNNLKKADLKVANKISNIVKSNFKLKTGKYINNRDNTLNIAINYSPLTKAFEKWFGKGVYNKKIPSFIVEHNKKIINSFLEGFIAGDGYYYKKRDKIQIGSVNKQLILQLQLLYAKLGILPNIYEYNRKGIYHSIKGTNLKNLKIYQLSYSKNRKRNDYIVLKDKILTKIRDIKKQKYSGFVYNIETKEHTYTANNCVVHNCHEVLHKAFEHLDRFTDKERDALTWNIACDVVVNNVLVKNNFSMNIDGCILPQNDEIEIFGKKITDISNKTAETIYDDIFVMVKNLIKQGKIKKGKGDNSRTGKGNFGFDEHIYGDKKDKTKGEKGKGDGEGEQNWKQIVSEAYTMAKNRGKTPLGVDRQIDDLLNSKLNWKEMLYRYITNTIPHDYSYCIDKNSKIETLNGQTKLKDVKKGDIVLGYKNGKIVKTTILTKFENISKNKKYIIYTEKGSRIICSAEHKFLTNKGYTEAKDLNIGDTLNRVKRNK